MTDRPLTILFMPESAYGPTNQCVGLGDILLKRGHKVVFAAESSWKGKLEPLGFVEALVDLAPPAEQAEGAEEEDAGKFWTDFIAETAPEFRKPTVDQLETFVAPTYQALIDGAVYCEPQLRAIIAEHQPDVIVEDNVVTFPALMTSGAPFVRIVSCNPLEVRGSADLPPLFAGYPLADREGWDAYDKRFEETHRAMWEAFNTWCQEQGTPPLPDLEFLHTSETLNLYVFPEEADYDEVRPLDETWARIDSSVRETDEEYVVPPEVADRPDDSALIYLSLGSLGGADLGLMQRLVDVLGTTRHRFVVSKGPRADELVLPETMVGAQMVPQTKVIPQVDLVITHGGNNTTTETLHFGKPMIVLPLFWDQYDNAQRVHELGFGRRLDTYGFEDAELIDAVEALLADTELRTRMEEIGARIRKRDGLRKGADLIEKVGLDHLGRAADPALADALESSTVES
ncbi:nucleotide disphospho-sugar-binding domain-containing protein [Mumia zhuanghuii]|uniref:Glycosyl transferase n=1 Tax=Mumia zhuanghuii TaxID=2585211 RepID=A0A5C4MCH5_9ACTN|nr:nucleotide disphospho-sugar-binding domain-containing protein [Mumia zhuanghuii]TNC32927.1 glycosyl transferase [Mumia zhuanghuii]TNC35674.1 glycosyl transferase [Mumia zhuanghuii]